MMMRRAVVLSVAALLVFTVLPAAAGQSSIRPTFRQEEVFFSCLGPTKVHQANWFAALGAESSFPGWTTTAPAQSAQQGGGCGAADWGGTTNAVYGPVFRGTFTGNLREFTVRFDQLLLGSARQGSVELLRITGDIDGVPIFPPGAQPSHGRTVTVTPVRSASGASERFEFTVTDVGFANDVLDENGEVVAVETGGMALEDGDGTEEHTLTLFLGVHGTALGQSPAGHKVATWAWGATDVPGGIVFNPPAVAAATVKADTPSFDWE